MDSCSYLCRNTDELEENVYAEDVNPVSPDGESQFKECDAHGDAPSVNRWNSKARKDFPTM